MPARNHLADLVRQLMTVEAALIKGTTVKTLADELGVSIRQVQRHLVILQDLGADVQSFKTKTCGKELERKVSKSSTVFRH